MICHLTSLYHEGTGRVFWGVIDENTMDIRYVDTDMVKTRRVCAGLRHSKCPCPDFWKCRRAMITNTAINK